MAVGEININQYSLNKGIWHFNGSSADSSSNGFNGTDTAITYTAGKFNSCANFNGSTSKIVFGNPIIPVGTKTVLAWIKTTNTGAQTVVGNLNFNTGAGDVMDIVSNVHRYNIYYGAGPSTVNLSGAKVITDGLWHLLVAVYDGTNLKIYTDGVLENTSANFTDSTARPNNCQMGIDVGAFNKNAGAIDEVAIYNVALTPKQITDYYAWSSGKRLGVA